MATASKLRRPRLILADDHRLVLEGLRSLLEPDFEIIACVENGEELLAAVEEHRPDIVVTDISMPGLSGIVATRRIKENHPGTRVILLTMHEEIEFAISALESQASGYVLKIADPDVLRAALREVAAGGTYVPPSLAADVFAAVRRGKERTTPVLSERQIDILRLLTAGMTAKEIALELGVSRKTIEYHKYRLEELLGVKTTAELIRYAVDSGLASG